MPRIFRSVTTSVDTRQPSLGAAPQRKLLMGRPVTQSVVTPLPAILDTSTQPYVTSLPGGDAGTAKTVGWMRKLIHQGSKRPEVRELAANLVMNHSTDQGKIGSIFEFVRNKMRYVRDPLHQELVAGATYHMDTLSTQGYARGDCDDHTVMLGAMLESVGYPTRIATARMKPGYGSFDHVYLEVNDRTGWIPLDASNKKREAGEAPPSNRLRRW